MNSFKSDSRANFSTMSNSNEPMKKRKELDSNVDSSTMNNSDEPMKKRMEEFVKQLQTKIVISLENNDSKVFVVDNWIRGITKLTYIGFKYLNPSFSMFTLYLQKLN